MGIGRTRKVCVVVFSLALKIGVSLSEDMETRLFERRFRGNKVLGVMGWGGGFLKKDCEGSLDTWGREVRLAHFWKVLSALLMYGASFCE